MRRLNTSPPVPRVGRTSPRYPRALGVVVVAAALTSGCKPDPPALAGEPPAAFSGTTPQNTPPGAQPTVSADPPPVVEEPPEVLGGVAPQPFDPPAPSGH